MKNLYCSMIHGGLEINFKTDATTARAQHCCLRTIGFSVDSSTNFWNDRPFIELREKNKTNQWDPGCSNCERLEQTNLRSFRQGMNDGLQIFGQTDLSGPARIDLMFDNSCNLACRICSPTSSTTWQKHLKKHREWHLPVTAPKNKDKVIQALKQIDLSNLRQLVFCGGETLLGREYWDIAEWLSNNVPDVKQNLTLCFQTNGTQNILPRNYDIIERFHLVKLHISIDGVEDQFDYMRWPAKWNQVTDNILSLRDGLPGNVMFVIEETISIFNLLYLNRLKKWVDNNFTHNRFGDIVNHTQHMVHGKYELKNCSQEYVDAVRKTKYAELIPPNWSEDKISIESMIKTIHKFDTFRNESFEKTFPELAEYYARFVN